MLPYSTREESGIVVVAFDDPAGLSGLSDLSRRDAIYALIPDRDEPCLVLNLEKADYLSSFGVATLIGLKRRIEARGGKLVLCCVHSVVRELLSMMNLLQLFTVAADEPTALSSLRRCLRRNRFVPFPRYPAFPSLPSLREVDSSRVPN